MNPTDLSAVIQWWLILFLIGVGFLPLTIRLFDVFFDKGYLFSKAIGLLLITYAIFVLSVFHIIPFHTPFLFGTSIAVILITFFVLPQKWKLLYVVKRFWFTIIVEELLFLSVLYLWAYVHSFAPDIHGLEKFMDYGFVNSFLRSDYLPPKDMWFTPFSINYYYFGHMVTALLTKLTGLPVNITFNLMLSTIVALCFTQTFSLGANLYYHLLKTGRFNAIKQVASGLLTAFLVTFSGNLHILYAFFKPYPNDAPVPPWQLVFNPAGFPNDYWYPNATRFIYNTIHEFPIYSWVVADLHGHVLDIPFVLLLVALLLSLTVSFTRIVPENEKEEAKEKTFQIHPALLILMGLILACMYMTNAWDGAIYLLLSALVITYLHLYKRREYQKLYQDEDLVTIIKTKDKDKPRFSLPEKWKVVLGRDVLLATLVIASTFFVFIIPYSIHFKPFASGIGVLCAPDFLTKIGKFGPFLFEVNHCQHSPWWQLLILYGFFFYFIIVFGVMLYKARERKPLDIFVLLLMVISVILIIIPEFIYLKDIYPAHYRANTMFKLVFQSFILLSISSSYVIIRLSGMLRDQDAKHRVYTSILLCISAGLVYLVMSYPFLAIKAYYNDFKQYQSLNGTKYLLNLYPNDYAGITWLNENVKGQPVILEAQGDSYTDYARVSANTGLPTVLGWTVHEWLWRGSYDIPAPRIEDVKTMYQSLDLAETKRLLDEYKVEYVFIGNMEYEKYPNFNPDKFAQLGTLVFQQGSTRIYKISH